MKIGKDGIFIQDENGESISIGEDGIMIQETKRDKISSGEEECIQKVKAQKDSLENDILAATETFEKYPITNILQKNLIDLNVKSNKFANEFRTKIRESIKKEGVNFAGSYSLVYISMTGWGRHYFIVERTTGEAYIFPYHAEHLEFKENSNLIIMNPQSTIEDIINFYDTPGCYFLHQHPVVDIRTFYFLWKNNELSLIGQKEIDPPKSEFWKE